MEIYFSVESVSIKQYKDGEVKASTSLSDLVNGVGTGVKLNSIASVRLSASEETVITANVVVHGECVRRNGEKGWSKTKRSVPIVISNIVFGELRPMKVLENLINASHSPIAFCNEQVNVKVFNELAHTEKFIECIQTLGKGEPVEAFEYKVEMGKKKWF